MAADMVGTEQRRDQPVNPLQDLPPLGFTGENEPRMGLEFFADPNNDAEEEILEQEWHNDARSDDDTEDERDRMHAIFQSLHESCLS